MTIRADQPPVGDHWETNNWKSKAEPALDKSEVWVPEPPESTWESTEQPQWGHDHSPESKTWSGKANAQLHLCMAELPPEGHEGPNLFYGCPAKVGPEHAPERYNCSAYVTPERPCPEHEPPEPLGDDFFDELPEPAHPPHMIQCRYDLPPEGKSQPPHMTQCRYDLPPEGKSQPPRIYNCRYDSPPEKFKL